MKKHKEFNYFMLGVIFIGLIFTILICLDIRFNKKAVEREKKEWNNGQCTHCEEGRYKFYYAFEEEYDCTIHHYWKCDNCGYALDLEHYNP